MEKVFIGKNQIPYSISELDINKLLNNETLLNMFSMKEFDELYKKYFGNYEPFYVYILSAKIKLYDKSDSINNFILKGKSYWFNKETRIGLMNLANCSTIDVPVVFGDEILTFEPEELKNFLSQLETYASQCYIQTKKHLLAIKELKTIDEIINYDYMSGYPDKINIE